MVHVRWRCLSSLSLLDACLKLPCPSDSSAEDSLKISGKLCPGRPSRCGVVYEETHNFVARFKLLTVVFH